MIKKEEKEQVNPVSEQEQARSFLKDYEALCQRYGLNIAVVPAFKSRDDGTWSIILQSSIGRASRQENKKLL